MIGLDLQISVPGQLGRSPIRQIIIISDNQRRKWLVWIYRSQYLVSWIVPWSVKLAASDKKGERQACCSRSHQRPWQGSSRCLGGGERVSLVIMHWISPSTQELAVGRSISVVSRRIVEQHRVWASKCGLSWSDSSHARLFGPADKPPVTIKICKSQVVGIEAGQIHLVSVWVSERPTSVNYFR